MKTRTALVVKVAVLIAAVVPTFASEAPEILGIFGWEDVTDETYLAAWIPIEEGAVVTGLRWFGGDTAVALPEIRAEGGLLSWPSSTSESALVATNVSGAALTWNEVEFSPAVTSDCGGLYLYLRLPPAGDGVFEIGYHAGTGTWTSWIANDGEHWNPMDGSLKMAAEPVLSMDKGNREALVLHMPSAGDLVSQPDGAEDVPSSEATFVLRTVPNPFNPSTRIEFATTKSGPVRLDVYDVRGRRVAELARRTMRPGTHSVIWDGQSLNGATCASGVYFVRLETEDGTSSKSVVLLK